MVYGFGGREALLAHQPYRCHILMVSLTATTAPSPKVIDSHT